MAFYPPGGMPGPAPPQGYTIANPPLPYTGSIGHVLQDGEMIVIQGYVPPNPDRFAVNLQTGSHKSSKIALHFNPRFADNLVVRNSFRKECWENEERHGTF